MKNLSGVKGVLLDFENTLIKFDTNWELLRQKLSSIFLSYGVEIYVKPLHAKLIEGLDLMRKREYSEKEIGLVCSKLFQEIEEFEDKAAENCIVFDDVKWFLEFLSSRKIHTAIISNNMSATVKKVFKKFKLDFNGMIIGRDKVNRPKPDTEGAKFFINKYKLNPDDCLIIGDSDYDMQIGKDLGCFCIFLKRSSLVVDNAKLDLTVTSLKHLKSYLNDL